MRPCSPSTLRNTLSCKDLKAIARPGEVGAGEIAKKVFYIPLL